MVSRNVTRDVAYHGWFQVAFDRELTSDLTPAAIGSLRLALVRRGTDVTAYDAVCPHRGAHLAYGGELDADAIVCPFHGRRIRLGTNGSGSYCVRSYPTLTVGGGVFVLLGDRHEHGFAELMVALDRRRFFVQGFSMHVRVPPEYVIENAFDTGHFKRVHGLDCEPELQLRPGEHGELVVEGTLRVRPSTWHGDVDRERSIATRFVARVISPALCVTEVGVGEQTHTVISAATPGPDGGSQVRVSIAVAAGPRGEPPSQQVVTALLRDSKTAFEQDRAIWENLAIDAPCRFAPEDMMVIEYHKFCRRLRADLT
jgi:phenylpropionate dioxygenase-like ring-hydroxylating dioxygenase large terminal subunit